MLTENQKKDIILAMQDYIARNGYSQNRLAKDTHVNIAYIDAMVKGVNSGIFIFNNVLIKDVYFQRIADFVGITLKKEYWQTFETEQYLIIESAFVEAKSCAAVKTVIGATGSGKSYTAERMKEKYPSSTFIIKCSNDFNLRDFIMHIAEIVGVRDIDTFSQSRTRLAVERRLKALVAAGEKPVLVFDEAENLKLPAWGRIKAIYDNLKNICGFLVMGTPNWYNSMKNKRDRERDIAPQIFRRFMSGLKTSFLPKVSHSDLEQICTQVGVTNSYVIGKVCTTTYNYGDLADTLVSLQRTAEITGRKIDRNLYDSEYGEAV